MADACARRTGRAAAQPGWRALARRSARVRGVLLVLACLCAFATLGRAQGGYTRERKPELGLAFDRARDYEELPISPAEEYVVLAYAEKAADDPKRRKRVRPELAFVWIEPPPQRTAGADGVVPALTSPRAPRSASDERAVAPAITSVAEYIALRRPGWELGQPVIAKSRAGNAVREYNLLRTTPDGRAAWMTVFDDGRRSLALLGTCDEAELRPQAAIWRRAAEQLEFREPEARDAAKLRLFYARKPFRGVDARIDVRQRLVRNWDATDTENFIVVYDTRDETLVRRLVRDLELLRAEYARVFPIALPPDAVAAVRLCKSRDEFELYGGPPGLAGFWHRDANELVVYDATDGGRDPRARDADTFVALYHEGLHQYFHAALGELVPHVWFNEGHGDYFAGARVKDGKVRSIGVMPWRVEVIRDALVANTTVPWREFVRYTRAQYCAPEHAHASYAQGWSMVYFLRESAAVRARPDWAKILPTYFETLTTTFAAALARLADASDVRARLAAGDEARTAALDAAFDGVDFAELETAWKTFTLSLQHAKD